MRDITVNKNDLLEKIKENRNNHRGVFEEAVKNYRKRVIEELDDRLDSIKKDKEINLYFHFPEPEDHTKDYDKVIRMLEMEVEETIKLSETDFSAYVMDDWAWRRAWLSNTASYTQG